MKKLLLILIYPFVYLFHPRIRRANALRIKYWAMDRDFFQEERKVLTTAGLLAIVFYGGLVYGIPALYYAGGHMVKASFNNVAEVNKDLIRDQQENVGERTAPAVEITPTVNPAYEEFLAKKAAVQAEKEKASSPQDEIDALIKKVEDKKTSQDDNN